MLLSIGDKLGPYEILALVGAGGMGEVYKARDTRLNRLVAIKFSKQQFSERFEREARAVAALNHPNICQLYDVGPNYLVMEFVEGEAPKGPMPLDEVLRIAEQLANALEAAHEKGIVHRDLKPGNIKITPEGQVKVLDFGLAKMPVAQPGEVSQDSPTITMAATEAGMILGTAGYMSPEQARGKPASTRADIWAFGVVLYDLTTGRPPFKGEDVTDTLAAIIKAQPDLNAVPHEIRRLLEACLEKDPKKRLQAIVNWRLLLDKPVEAAAAQGTAPSRRGVWGWMVAGAAILAAIPLGYVAYRHNTEEAPRVLRLTVPLPEGQRLGAYGIPQLSPDGRRIAYTVQEEGNGQLGLWVRELDSLTSRLLIKEAAYFPFWSPDGRSVGFWSNGKLQKIDVSGGPTLTLCNAPVLLGGTWNRDDVILFAPASGPIQRVSAAGGAVSPATTLDTASGETHHRYPSFLPDGRHFFYTSDSNDEEKTAIYVGDLQSKERRTRVMYAKSSAVYAPPGYILFLRESTLMAQPFDAGSLRVTGDASPIAEQVDFPPAPFLGNFSASQDGTLAYTSGAWSRNVQMTWFDRSGKPLGTVGSPGEMGWTAISPDGKTVAFDRRDPQTGHFDIWLRDLVRGTDSRLTFNSKSNRYPVWSPDGRELAFSSDRGHVYKRTTAGVGQDQVVDNDELTKRPTGWSPDGRFIVEESAGTTPKTLDDIWIAPAAGGEKPHPYLQTEFLEGEGNVSPNGKWLAYYSYETKRSEIYIMTFPNPGGKWPISTEGGSIPVWSRDGKELFYVGANNKMMAVDIKGTGVDPEPGVPHALFDVRLGTNTPNFDVAPDGRFLIATPLDQTSSAPITVVVNWLAGLKK